ncbi:MAG TPA: hypothetical protein VD866_01520 [Urbifossiella sp.]|nr:hypothetical protein [Urbifossiella sp.]
MPLPTHLHAWTGPNWEVRALPAGTVSLILNGGSPVISIEGARELSVALALAAATAEGVT